MTTKFFLATRPETFLKCHRLLERLGRKATAPFTTPTVIALRDGKFVGFAATGDPKHTDGIVMLTEMAIDPDITNNQHLIFKLLDTYNAVMAYMGVEFYYSAVAKQPEFQDQIDAGRKLWQVWQEDEHFVWFKHIARRKESA